MHNYPSDITREQFEIIRETLENARKITKPRKMDLYNVFCGLLYILKVVVNGECFLKITLNGEQFIHIFKYGVKKEKMELLFLEEVLKNYRIIKN